MPTNRIFPDFETVSCIFVRAVFNNSKVILKSKICILTQDATHGNSISHRALGSTGQCQDPGRVFKGKKMPGHLGNVNRTIQNLTIVKIMPNENIMLIKGSVPGHKGSVVVIKPTEKKYTAKEIFSEKEEVKVIDNHDESIEAVDSNATKDMNLDHNSSVTESDSSNEDKDRENEESKNE